MINRMYITLGYQNSATTLYLATATLLVGTAVLIASIFSKPYAIAPAAIGGTCAGVVMGKRIAKRILPFDNAYLGRWYSSPTERALFTTLTREEQENYTPETTSLLEKFKEMSREDQEKFLQDDREHYKGKCFHEWYETATAVNAAAVCSIQQ